MKPTSERISRRTILKSVAGLAVAQLATTPMLAAAGDPDAPRTRSRPVPAGKPGEFDFLAGEWRIRHRRLKQPTDREWDEFAGEATCWSILGGVGSIEELRIPERQFSGMGLRLLDVEAGVWSDFWVNAKNGVLGTPGTPGGFANGVGTFIGDDMDGERPILVRGVWDRITRTSCRWHQAVSYDAGATWQENWWMDWVRA